MSAKVRSAKGEIVDFDLIKLKTQIIEASPKTKQIKKREKFIDKKRRKSSSVINKLVEENSK